MSRFYVKATSDTGKGTITKGGNGELHVEVSVDTPAGRSYINIDCKAGTFGKSDVTIRKRVKEGLRVSG